MKNAEIMLKAYAGSSIIHERQKAICKEHVERRKKLIHLMELVNKAESAPASQGQLAGVGGVITLTPELSDLLENPLHGL